MAAAAGGNDADAFLTALESKLRGPFSSVEVPKAIAEKSAIHLLRTVLSRAQKVTQLRVLTGLLGVVNVKSENNDHIEDAEDSDDTAINLEDVKSIITMAQQAPEYEEWVRVIAGIVQGVMYGEEGEEATKVLENTCREIMERVRTVQQQTAVVDEDADFLLQQDDIDPTFAPYWQSLLNKPLIDDTHHHFIVNEDAEILHLDDKVEEAKSKEEAVHDKSAAVRASATKGTKTTAPVADFPGFRSTSKSKTNVQRPKSSLFIPSKKPQPMSRPLGKNSSLRAAAVATTTTAATTTADGTAAKSLIHKRKPGAAQALLAKGRSKGSRVGASRMKTIDVSESKEKLEVQQQQQLLNNNKKSSIGKKRSLPPLASPEAKKVKNGPSELDRKQEEKEEQQQQQQQQQHQVEPSSPQRKEDWRKILAEHSNKITDPDRERVRQFFEERVNPTPDQANYRMKLHEEQSIENGLTVKVTYYLHLDYTNFTSKQTKKKKEYQ